MAIAGIITGLVGSFSTSLFSWLNTKEKNKIIIAQMGHEAKRWDFQKEITILQSQAKVSEFEMKALLEQVQGSWAGLEASIKAQIASGQNAGRTANSIVTLFRPFITLLLIAAMFYFTQKMLVEEFAKAAFGIVAIIELASMAVSWWFGDRSMKRGLQNTQSASLIRGADGEF